MIAIPNMERPKGCVECQWYFELYNEHCTLGKFLLRKYASEEPYILNVQRHPDCPLIDIVRCVECKHRPIKDDPNGADYGFNIVAPTDGDDLCPCLVEDGWYSWMPEDNFYCGRGKRRSDD